MTCQPDMTYRSILQNLDSPAMSTITGLYCMSVYCSSVAGDSISLTEIITRVALIRPIQIQVCLTIKRVCPDNNSLVFPLFCMPQQETCGQLCAATQVASLVLDPQSCHPSSTASQATVLSTSVNTYVCNIGINDGPSTVCGKPTFSVSLHRRRTPP